jgi:aminoglycoside/choline kinase family phosphotransferase
MQRLAALERWLAGLDPDARFTLAPASADASFRRYFRVTFTAGAYADPTPGTAIAMDAPPEHEDCRPFVHVSGLLERAGLNAPRVLAQDLAQGFLLLTDLGTTTYLAALERDRGLADRLFADATDALVKWQLASRRDELPAYDAALLRRELELFPEWYVGRHLGATLSPADRETIDRAFALIVGANLAQPMVFVHRDYMPRNLMISEPNPGILDFQDAVYGPITYDVASLVKDAFISWEEERALDWTIRYWEKAKRARLPVDADFAAFWRDCEWMGLQRHLKVAGIFARLAYRDGKRQYLDDTPRFIGYIRPVLARYRALAPLAALVDRLEGRGAETRYSF